MIKFNQLHCSAIKKQHSKKYVFNAVNTIMFLGFLFITGLNGYSQTKAKDKLLDGKTFQVTFTEQGKKKDAPAADEILFRLDKINSNYMLKENNFTASAYSATADSTSGTSIISFSSDSKNADNDKLKWEGTVNGENIQGKATMTDKKGNIKKEYAFSGKLKVYRKK
jgi:hypothetical protein